MSMETQPRKPNENDEGDPEDTLIVPPPGFRERLLAAQRARSAQNRPSTEFQQPEPSDSDPEEKTDPAGKS
jgi:hypothetical protein